LISFGAKSQICLCKNFRLGHIEKSQGPLLKNLSFGHSPPTHARYLAGPTHGIIYQLKPGSPKYRNS